MTLTRTDYGIPEFASVGPSPPVAQPTGLRPRDGIHGAAIRESACPLPTGSRSDSPQGWWWDSPSENATRSSDRGRTCGVDRTVLALELGSRC